MFDVDGKKIYLTRGDTFYSTITMTRNGVEYIPDERDTMRFVLKRAGLLSNGTAYRDSRPLLDIDIPVDTCLLKIEPEDTKKLKFGSYVYDIEITFANGDVDTFINNAEFELVPEVG